MVNNNKNISSVPISLSIAAEQTSDVIEYLGTLTPDEQQEVINYTHTLQSNQGAENYLNKFSSFL